MLRWFLFEISIVYTEVLPVTLFNNVGVIIEREMAFHGVYVKK